MQSSQRITTNNATLVQQAQKEDMARTEDNESLTGKTIFICRPTVDDHSEGSAAEYGNVSSFAAMEGQEISIQNGNTILLASPTRSTSTEAQHMEQGEIESPLLKSLGIFYYDSDSDSDSESDSEYEIPKISQADINDRSRQMNLLNILDF